MIPPGKRSHRGSVAVEFALSFAALWAIFAGVFQFGYSMYVYNSLTAAVANAALFAARTDFDEPDHLFVARLKNFVVYGSPDGGTQPLAPGLKPDNVNVTWTKDASGYPLAITISITGYSLEVIFSHYAFDGKPRTTVPFLGTYKT
jgi:Flp pilus assembly protein TadG